MTLMTRYVRRRGEWVAMVTNILPDQVARAEADPERGEEDAVHVPNALAVRAEALRASLKAVLDDFVELLESGDCGAPVDLDDDPVISEARRVLADVGVDDDPPPYEPGGDGAERRT